MDTKTVLLLILLVCCILVKYPWPETFRRFYFRYIDWRCSAVEENWKKARARREEWEAQNPYAPAWHEERQELLRIELGAYMLFVDRGPRFQDEILRYRARDLQTLAEQIVDGDDIFQSHTDEE